MQFPRKTDLVDEAPAKLNIELTSKPQEIDELDRKIIQLQMELMSLNRDHETETHSRPTTSPHTKRVSKIEDTIHSLQRRQEELKSRWDLERSGVNKMQEIRNEIDQVAMEVDKAERETNLQKTAELKYGTMPDLQQQLQTEEELYAKKQEESANTADDLQDRLVRDTVTNDDIAAIVSRWTGIPVTKLVESEMHKLLRLEDELDKSVIGQHEATKVVAEAIQRSRAGMTEGSERANFIRFKNCIDKNSLHS